MVLPSDNKLKQDIISNAHDSKIAGHRGAQGTLKSIALSFWWPGMDEDIKLFVRSCLQCQRNKAGNKHNKPPSKPLPVPTAQFQSISMDLITDLPKSRGYDSIFVLVDRLTKMVFAFPCNKDITAIQLAKLLMEKRGQVAVFVIIAVLIVVGGILVYFFVPIFRGENAKIASRNGNFIFLQANFGYESK
jgi:hypothetical protein